MKINSHSVVFWDFTFTCIQRNIRRKSIKYEFVETKLVSTRIMGQF